eukprot:CAMPEP_0201232510 /NCGR_PEP_ID=MMETSP0852-20130820/4364_1 /ASSEMBLY_ACC=CAM_ASM_000632 /TAXON_ID=183588 /ORGANISM="Pseudo-nitzschia fraudulenta, Strain WWA7" /LENGTH=57 /DNA_ID=CAMNT_0047524941 /DNA_START=30 /DNA_END=200 /DNA_ORIENTATION=+
MQVSYQSDNHQERETGSEVRLRDDVYEDGGHGEEFGGTGSGNGTTTCSWQYVRDEVW